MAHLAARTAKRQRVPWNSVAGPRWCWTQVETFPIGTIGLQFWKFLGLYFFWKVKAHSWRHKDFGLDYDWWFDDVFFSKEVGNLVNSECSYESCHGGWPTKTVTQIEFLRRISGEEQSHHQPGGVQPPSEMAVNIAEEGHVGWIRFLYVVVCCF